MAGVKLLLECVPGHGNSCVFHFFCPAAPTLPAGYSALTPHAIIITGNRGSLRVF